jgi:adenylate cyclase
MSTTVTYSSLIAEAKTLISSCATELEELLSGAGFGESGERGPLGQDELRAGVRMANRIAVVAGLLAFKRLRDLAASMRSACLLAASEPEASDLGLFHQASVLIRRAAQALDLPAGYGEMLRPDGTTLRPPLKRDIDVTDLCVELNRGSKLKLIPFDGRFLEEGPGGIFRLSVDPERAEQSRSEGKWLSLAYFDGGVSGEQGPVGLAETANALTSLIARGEIIRYGGLSMSYSALNGVRAILPCYCLLETGQPPEDCFDACLPDSRLLKILASPNKAFVPEPGSGGPSAASFRVFAGKQDESLSIGRVGKVESASSALPPLEDILPDFEALSLTPPEELEASLAPREKSETTPAPAFERRIHGIDPNALDKELPPGIVLPEIPEDSGETFQLEDFKRFEHEIHEGSGNAEIEALLSDLNLEAEEEPKAALAIEESGPLPSAPEPEAWPEPIMPPLREYAPPVRKNPKASPSEQSRPEALATPEKRGRRQKEILPQDLRIRLPISVKLIVIISFFIFISLGTMIASALVFFRATIKNQVTDSNIQVAEVMRQKFDGDFQAIAEKGSRLIQDYLDQSSSASATLSDAQSALIFGSEKEVLFAGAYPEGDGGPLAYLPNRKLLKGLNIDEKALTDSIGSRRKEIARAAGGESLCVNVSAAFRDPTALAAWNFKAAGRNGALVVIFSTRDRLQGSVEAKHKAFRQQFLLSQDGELLAHPDANLVSQGLDYSSRPFFETIQKSGALTGEFKFVDDAGVRYVATYSRLRSLGAWVVSAIEEKNAFKPVSDVQLFSLFIAIMVLAVAILMVWFYSKTLTIPIHALVSAVHRIEAGQFALDLKARAHDELGLLTNSVVAMGRGLAERERLKDTFGKFVNKEIAEQAQRGTLKLGGERKTATVFFSDIRGFTSISEKLEPEEVVEFLNQYMTRMVKCVNSTGGLVDKYIGDAIMAVWGVTQEAGVNDASSAINAALMMRKELIDFNRERGGPHSPLIRIGCGINSGPVISGQIGSEERMEYTVIGDTVNLASRIEALNKPFGTDILISKDSYDKVSGEFRMEPMKPILVKGKLEPQQIYTVLGRLDDPYCPRSLSEIQSLLGIEHQDLSKVDVEAEEVKYKIVDSPGKGGAR